MPHLTLTDTPSRPSVDLKANGEVSRMRSHKGNMPSLPQTKYCALCPAKFTRTTHLNRHLRSHTNERAHRCNTCTAEFTRSDLLTRHKRTCGDSNVNRSRRKSCQACAESKVKCNLQHPCSKCSARGRDCVFINDPEASRNRKFAAKKSPRESASPSEGDFSESSAGIDSFGPSSPTSTLSYSPHGGETFPHVAPSPQMTSPIHSNPQMNFLGGSSASDSSSACSSRSSPQLEYFDSRQDPATTYNLGYDVLQVEPDMNNFFPNNADPYVQDPFSPCLPRVQTEMDVASWFDSNQSIPSSYGNHDPLLCTPQSQPRYDQEFVSGASTLPSSPITRQSFSTPTSTNGAAGYEATSTPTPAHPTPEDLELYMYLFFAEFNVQIPLFHRPSWRMENVHPLLLRAMQACGASFAKTAVASTFVYRTLTSSRDALLAEFSKPTATLKDQMFLLLAVVLLQSIGLLQHRPDQRALSKMYHDILVMMVHKTCLIKLTASWLAPDLSNLNGLETAWRDWGRYETFKRALVFAYLQDCSYAIHYSAMPSFDSAELEVCLPCDDTLWRAQTSREWFQIQRTPSPYGTGIPRILGVSMQQALAALAEPSPSLIPYTINPFASLVLVHTILRDIFSPASRHLSSPTLDGCSGGNPVGLSQGGSTFMIQCALHNWQRMWSSSPEAVQLEKLSQGVVPFASNAIPFYWLARFAEGAKQNGTLLIDAPLSSRMEVEDRYRMIKAWLAQIHDSLQTDTQQSSPATPYWSPQHPQQAQLNGASVAGVGMTTFSPSQ